jgi:RNA polymerase primary sigma factor
MDSLRNYSNEAAPAFDGDCELEANRGDVAQAGSGCGLAPELLGRLSISGSRNVADFASSADLRETCAARIRKRELLSREEELALAKAIEAAQQTLLGRLSRVPIVMDQIGGWAREIRAQRLAPGFLVDAMSAHGKTNASADLRAADALSAPQEELPGTASLDGDDASVPLGPGGGGPCPELSESLDGVCRAADEIGKLVERRAVALGQGGDLPTSERLVLDGLLSHAAAQVTALGIHPDRIAELATDLQANVRNLDLAECQLQRREVHRAELERDGRDEADRLSGSATVASTKATLEPAGRLDPARSEVLAIAQRLGMPVPELRQALAEVGAAQHELDQLRELMVRAHQGLVRTIARKYSDHSSLDLADLIQEGTLGLMRGIEKYSYRRGVKVSTYASWWIRQAITRAMADQGRTIRVPVHMAETARQVQRERGKFQRRHGRNPHAEEIAAQSGIRTDQIARSLALVGEPKSLDAPVGEDGDASLGDLIEDTAAISPHAAAESDALRNCLADVLSELTPREERILRLRFGMGGASEHTLAEIGETFGVTRERIRQIEAKALDKLRSSGLASELRAFLED